MQLCQGVMPLNRLCADSGSLASGEVWRERLYLQARPCPERCSNEVSRLRRLAFLHRSHTNTVCWALFQLPLTL